ncbi:MAG: VanZ family protein [Verrucomicrobia bacterium]|nr:VanZ family protein [Verrucomicrobiota bacterium]
MSRLGSYARYWTPVILWMALIFSASTDTLSSARTSRILGPFLRWIHPGVSEQAIHRVQVVVRKGGHVTEYAVLALLASRALRRGGSRTPAPRGGRASGPAAGVGGGPGDSGPPRWRWSQAGVALGVAVLYAITDEWHQGLVPTRDGRATDVLWDAAGAAAGLAGAWVWGRWKRRW